MDVPSIHANTAYVRVKQENQPSLPPQVETDMDSTTTSTSPHTDKLAFAAATAMMMVPQSRHDDDQDQDQDQDRKGEFPKFFGEGDSSDSYASIKTEDGGSEEAETGRRAMTPEQRRARRNLKERERVQNVKGRIEKLRMEVAALNEKHDAMQKELEQRMVLSASSDEDIQARVAAYLTKPDTPADARDAALVQEFLKLEKETQQLQFLKRILEGQLRPKAAHTANLTAVLDGDQSLVLEPLDSSVSTSLVGFVDPLDSASPVRIDAVTLVEAMLADDPLTPEEARGFVEDACRAMMEGLARRDWVEGFEGFGWNGSRRLDTDGLGLEFRLSQTFASVSASVLVEKTWHMLTNLEAYRRIQPSTRQLRVIQRVNDECWVIGIQVGKERARVGQILVARAIIHGGYLVTFRSLPLLRKSQGGSEHARQQFIQAETGAMVVSIHSWYNFQERPNATGGVDCEVIFGGTSHNGDRHYLKELQTEVVAGITRWQTALGFSSFFLSSSALADEGG